MMCGCDCLEIWTPAKVLECCEDDNGDPIDCFEQAVPDSDLKPLMVKALWQRFRFVPIDSLNIDRWLEVLKGRAGYIDRRYQILIKTFDNNDMGDLFMGFRDTADETTQSSASGTSEVVNSSEDLPQSAAPTGQWLTGRNTADGSNSSTDSGERHSKVTHEAQDAPIGAEFSELMDRLRDPLNRYTEEFSDLFMNRW